MTKAELVTKVAEEAGIKKVEAEKAINTLLGAVKEVLKKEGRMALTGFGTFTVSKRKARTGRNPQTGQPIKIKAAKAVKFRPGKDLKNYIK
ncbi:MAG: HU family DNA-binding protein [Thermodesulfobacteriota bacterium]